MMSLSEVCWIALQRLPGRSPAFWYQSRSPSRSAANWSAMIVWKVSPTIAPAAWRSARPPVQRSTLSTLPNACCSAGDRAAVVGDLAEVGVRLEAERLARLVERAEAEVAAALDVDRGEVHRTPGGSNRKLRRSSTMRASIACEGRSRGGAGSRRRRRRRRSRRASGRRCRCSAARRRCTAPCSSSLSVSAETIEWPKRKAAPANSSEMRGSTVRS